MQIEPIKIKRPVLDHNRLAAEIEIDSCTRNLWFSVPEAHAEHLCDSADAFVIALLFAACRRGTCLQTEAPVSASLLHGVNNARYDQALAILIGGQEFSIEAPSHAPLPCKGLVATGFSAGIDSFTTLNEHRIDAVIFNEVGSHGKIDAADVIRKRMKNVEAAAKIRDLEVINIKSNLEEFFDGLPFAQTHSLRNLAAASTLQGYISHFYYSSAYQWEEYAIKQAGEAAWIDPLTTANLCLSKLRFAMSGSNFSRLEKTIRLADTDDARMHLDVCVEPSKAGNKLNCGTCFKCMRALLVFEALGKLDAFEATFRLDRYRETRHYYRAVGLPERARTDRSDRDVLDFINKTGLPGPSFLRATSWRVRSNLTRRRA